MARPKVPLISVDAVIAAALELLARDGYQAFSLRSLGARLNVNFASIYHHFRNKDEILMAAVRFALREIALPAPAGDWRDFLCEASVGYRRLLVAKPFLVPIMLSGIRPVTRAFAMVDAKLGEAGIAAEWRPEILHTLDNAVVASAVVSINAPMLNQGRSETYLDHEALLRATLRLLIDQMEAQFRARS
jgi:TetR/AcrR family transcriptional regulator, tetracycline repressor protein